jgi:hypothetical protein
MGGMHHADLAAGGLRFAWNASSWVQNCQTHSSVTKITLYALQELDAAQYTDPIRAAAIELAREVDVEQIPIAVQTYLRVVVESLAQLGIPVPAEAMMETAALAGGRRDNSDDIDGASPSKIAKVQKPEAKYTTGLTIKPVAYVKSLLTKKKNAVNIEGKQEDSDSSDSGNEDQDDRDKTKRRFSLARARKSRPS